MSRIDVEVGSKIRQIRQSRRMTQDELATAIHKSRATLSKYESGDISIDLNTLSMTSPMHLASTPSNCFISVP